MWPVLSNTPPAFHRNSSEKKIGCYVVRLSESETDEANATHPPPLQGTPKRFEREGEGERKRERAPATAGAAKSSYRNVNGLKKRREAICRV